MDSVQQQEEDLAGRSVRSFSVALHPQKAAGGRFSRFENDWLYLPAICFSCASIIFLIMFPKQRMEITNENAHCVNQYKRFSIEFSLFVRF